MVKTLLYTVNTILDYKKPSSVVFIIILFISLFRFFSEIYLVFGGTGSPQVAMIILIVSMLIILIITILYFTRWELINWGIKNEIDKHKELFPDVIIGVGIGGGIIAGMISKYYSEFHESSDKEPTYCVFGREFYFEDKHWKVKESDCSELSYSKLKNAKQVLIVTAEVISANTIKCLIKKLDDNKIKYTSFTFLESKDANYKCKIKVLVTNNRAILPWVSTPDRRNGKVK